MAEEIVKVIRVDTKGSNKTINQLKKEIKELKSALESTAVGSAEFEAKLKALGQAQQQYASINMDIAARTQDMEKSFKNLAQFGGNLTKSFSSINAMVGLLGGNAEDANKALLKVAQTMQLVQGISGFGQVLGQLPKITAQFRSWADAILPINRRINDIATSLNGIDGKTLSTLETIAKGNTNINVNGADSVTTAVAGGGFDVKQVNAQNEAIKQQTSLYPALINEKKSYVAKLKEELATQKETLSNYEHNKQYYEDAIKFTNNYVEATKIAGKEITLTGNAVADANVMFETANEYMQKFGYTTKEVIVGLKNLKQISSTAGLPSTKTISELTKNIELYKRAIAETEEEIESMEVEIQALEKAAKASSSTLVKGINVVKAALKSAGFMILVTGVIALLERLVKVVVRVYNNWMYSANQAAKAQETINKGLAQTAQLAAKPIAVLYELANAYKKVGDSAQAKADFLQKYADKIKETGIEINDVVKAEDVFVKNTQKYVDALMARAKAQATENTAITLYQEFLEEQDRLEQEMVKKRGVSKEQFINLLVATGTSLEDAERAWYESTDKKVQDIFRKMDINEQKINDRLKRLFEDVADLNNQYEGVFASSSTKTETKPDGKDKKAFDIELELLKTYTELQEKYADMSKSAKDKEIEEVESFYDHLITLANYYGINSEEMEKSRAKALADIDKKYREQALKEQEEETNRQLEELQKQIERIRKMKATSNLQEPREQTFQTNYVKPGSSLLHLFGIRGGEAQKYTTKDENGNNKVGSKNGSWISTYQSKEDVENQYKAQIEYNNKTLELTKSRIEQENELLKKQLEVIGITEDQKFEIERTIAENEMALSDAVAENEQKNLEAYKKVQEAKQQALTATLEVASSVMGSLASIAQTEMNNDKKSEKERKKAADAYATLGIAQATIDTYKSANEAYASMASIPYVGPVLGAAAAGAAIVSGIANVKQIIQTAQQAKLSASASVSTDASSTPPSALNTNPITYTRNLLGDKETDELNKPIKCYVLQSEIDAVNTRVKVTEQNASF